jgi:putative N6-adenine-specific DNA methylase
LNNVESFFAPCPRGLEGVLADELRALGALSVETTDGGAGFRGELPLAYRANLHSRIASRVLWRVGHAPYANERDIYAIARFLPWREWFDVARTLRVNLSATRSRLPSLDFATLRVKDAVCDSFRDTVGERPSIDKAEPDVRIHAYLTESECTLYLDTSGAALFQRGYRRATNEAPLRENLAAGILRLIAWDPATPLLDPMCGSGTFLIEAAHMARNVPPGYSRRFGFEHLRWFDARAWQACRDEASANMNRERSLEIHGSDSDPQAIAATRTNLAGVGLAEAIRLECIDVLQRQPPAPSGALVCNPPYGVRLADQAHLASFYPLLGDALKRHFAGWHAYLLSADMQLPKLIGLKASRRTPLYNGTLECRLYGYGLVAGSARRPRPEPR